MGHNSDPQTLHKYMYTHADPINNIDPTGHYTLSGLSTALNIRGILTVASRTHAGMSWMDTIINGDVDELDAKAIGMTVIMTLLPGNLASKFYGLLKRSCRNSFELGTLVHSEFGMVPIEDIKIGDKVWSWSSENNELVLEEVVHLIQGEKTYDLVKLTVEGEQIISTLEHPFYVNGSWVPASDLLKDDVLKLVDGESILFDRAKETKHSSVFNLTIANTHNYFIGEAGVLVHNTNVECVKLPKLKTKGRKNRNHPHISENAADWGNKGPHIKYGKVELLLDAGPAGDINFKPLGKVSSREYKEAVAKARKALKDEGYRIRLYNAAAKGYETAKNEAKNLKQGKVQQIENVLSALLRSL